MYENTGTVMSVIFVKDYNYDSYERQVFSVLELIGSLGGLFEIFSIIGGLFAGVFTKMLFNYSIIQSLYHVDTLSSKSQMDQDLTPKAEMFNETGKQLNSSIVNIAEENKSIPKPKDSELSTNQQKLNLTKHTKIKKS